MSEPESPADVIASAIEDAPGDVDDEAKYFLHALRNAGYIVVRAQDVSLLLTAVGSQEDLDPEISRLTAALASRTGS